MSNYTKTTDFSAKDDLPSGDPDKVVVGAEIDAEFDAIQTAVATKANSADVPALASDNTLQGLLTISAVTPRFRLHDSNAGANAKYTEFNGNSGFAISLLDDSAANPVTALSIARSGTTVSGIALNALTTVTVSGANHAIDLTNGTVTATLTFSGTPSMQFGTTTNHGIDFFTNGASRFSIPSIGGVRIIPVNVASLPSAATVGTGGRHHVTDATATTFNSVVAGGGANSVPVFSDGTNWRIG